MRIPIVFAATVLAVAAACGDHGVVTQPDSSGYGTIPSSLASCGSSHALYSVLPVAASNLMGWVPLGAQNPVGHTFPTDHQ